MSFHLAPIIPAKGVVPQLTETQILLFCHSREGGNPELFQDVRFLDAGRRSRL
jgi:hypothetical protein